MPRPWKAAEAGEVGVGPGVDRHRKNRHRSLPTRRWLREQLLQIQPAYLNNPRLPRPLAAWNPTFGFGYRAPLGRKSPASPPSRQAYPKVTRKLVRGWHGDNERWGCPGRFTGVGVSMAGRGRRRGISRAFPGRAVRRKPIGCGAAGTGGRGATWRCSAGPSGMPPVRAAGGSGWRQARPAGERRSGGSPGGCSRSARSRARWRSRRC